MQGGEPLNEAIIYVYILIHDKSNVQSGFKGKKVGWDLNPQHAVFYMYNTYAMYMYVYTCTCTCTCRKVVYQLSLAELAELIPVRQDNATDPLTGKLKAGIIKICTHVHMSCMYMCMYNVLYCICV